MKKVVIMLMALFILVIVSGCKQKESELYKPNVNVFDKERAEQGVLIDRETGVQYIYIREGYASGLTVRLNSDGTPMLLEDLKK